MKILFVTLSNNETYDPEKHLKEIWNFLYWKGSKKNEECLIAGDGIYNDDFDGSHKNLLECAKRNGYIPPPHIMDGAGNCIGRGGKITSWKSTGFGVTTPEDLRSIILEALRATE